MTNNVVEDPQTLWQTQRAEGTVVSAEELQRRADRLKARTRLGGRIWVAVGIAQIVVSVARQYLEQSVLGPWLSVVDYVSLTVLLLYWPYLSAFTTHSPISLALTAGSTPSFEFYRRCLDLQRDFFRYDYGGLPKLIVAVLVLILFAYRHPQVMITAGSVALIVGVVFYLRMKRSSASIQQEIDELNAFRS